MREQVGRMSPTGSRGDPRVGVVLLFGTVVIIYLRYKNYIMTREQIEQNFVIKKVKDSDKETVYTIELPNNDGEAKICITKPQVKLYGNFLNVIQKYEHLIK
jgi:hypothetical protein